MKLYILFGMALLILTNISAADETLRGTIEYDDMQRTFTLFLPSAYDENDAPLPLSIALHPSGSRAATMAAITGFNTIAEREGFVVLYPEGPGGYWDYGAGTSQWETVTDQRDDPGFLAFLINTVIEEMNVDPQRVYVAGFSNGARMAFRLACDMGGQLAGVAAVSATISDEVTAQCEHQTSIFYAHGTADAVTPWDGKPLYIGATQISTALSAPETIAFWVAQNGCDPEAIEHIPHTEDQIIGAERYCGNAYEVLFHPVYDGGHEWFTLDDFDISEAIWTFFASKILPLSAESTPEV